MGYEIHTDLPCASRLYMPGRMGKAIDCIVIHYTADAGTAWANAEYARRGLDGDPYIRSAHYYIDSESIYRSVAEEDTAWHSGNDDVSHRSIGIEVCSLGEDFTQGEIDRLAWLVQDIMARYGIAANDVFRHYDVVDRARYGSTANPHKTCPAPYVPTYGDPTGEKWAKLHATITGGGREMPMEFIGRSNTKEQLMYFCGMDYMPIHTQAQSDAIQQLYRKMNGSSIPMIESPYVAAYKAVLDGAH